MDNAERRPIDLNHLLTETLDLVKAQAAEQGIRLEPPFGANLPPVSGSASALGQVVLNLVSNAMQAMPQGGCLTVSTSYRPESRQVELLFSDTGPGISEGDRSHLFEPFFTTRPAGTGLGLALCREIVANHKGTIEYVTRDSSGAAFRILLPIDER
jgi:two-component system sensor histidine kinase HydH